MEETTELFKYIRKSIETIEMQIQGVISQFEKVKDEIGDIKEDQASEIRGVENKLNGLTNELNLLKRDLEHLMERSKDTNTGEIKQKLEDFTLLKYQLNEIQKELKDDAITNIKNDIKNLFDWKKTVLDNKKQWVAWIAIIIIGILSQFVKDLIF